MRIVKDVLTHVRAEYLEMPGLRLRPKDVERLCGIDGMVCQTVLDALVDANFLCLKSDGTYARASEGDVLGPQGTKADLPPEPSQPGAGRRLDAGKRDLVEYVKSR